jgi:arylsulfatase A-like enzyme
VTRPNILFITLDQFRGDSLSAAGHPVVRTPHLDRLATSGVRLARHYAQSNPCAPGRACLYTGTYQLNNRVVSNGTPLDDRFDNIARAARRAGYEPAMWGYTDQGLDPTQADGPDDPRLDTYEGILPGFDAELDMPAHHRPWRRWLEELGYERMNAEEALETEPDRPVEHGVSAFLTDRLLDWIARQDEPWFAHASYLRPHPPYAAAGHWSTYYDDADVGEPIAPVDDPHPLHRAALSNQVSAAPTDPAELRHLRRQYFGMISDVDAQLGRVWDALQASGAWESTYIVVTADHGEQLGDHGLQQKVGWFEESHHIVGIVRDPSEAADGGRGSVIERFTENVDIFPTLCEAMGIDIPVQCDGLPLTPLLRGQEPPWWRDAAHWEFDWRDALLAFGPHEWPWDRRLERQHLAVRRSGSLAYVQFGNGSWKCFDLAADPTWRTEVTDPALVLPEAQAMLTWRSRHAERTWTSLHLGAARLGRWPEHLMADPVS